MAPTDTVRPVPGEEGTIARLEPPEYHGRLIESGGIALCSRYFGFKALANMRDAGFEHARFLFYWSPGLGNLGVRQVPSMVRKPRA